MALRRIRLSPETAFRLRQEMANALRVVAERATNPEVTRALIEAAAIFETGASAADAAELDKG